MGLMNPSTRSLGMALLHLQYSSIIVWTYCQDAEGASPTLPNTAQWWSSPCRCNNIREMYEIVQRNSESRLRLLSGCWQQRLISCRACTLDGCVGAGRDFRSSCVKLQKVQEQAAGFHGFSSEGRYCWLTPNLQPFSNEIISFYKYRNTGSISVIVSFLVKVIVTGVSGYYNKS